MTGQALTQRGCVAVIAHGLVGQVCGLLRAYMSSGVLACFACLGSSERPVYSCLRVICIVLSDGSEYLEPSPFEVVRANVGCLHESTPGALTWEPPHDWFQASGLFGRDLLPRWPPVGERFLSTSPGPASHVSPSTALPPSGWLCCLPEGDALTRLPLALPFALWHSPTCPGHPVSGWFILTSLLPGHVAIPYVCHALGPWPPAGGRFLSTPPWSLPEGGTLIRLLLALPLALGHSPTCPGHPVSGRFLSTPLLPDQVAIPYVCHTLGPWPPAGGRFLSTPPWSLPEGGTLIRLLLALPLALGHSPTCPGHPVSGRFLSTPPYFRSLASCRWAVPVDPTVVIARG